MPDALMLQSRIRFISLIQAGSAFPQSEARHFQCYAIENLRTTRLDGGFVRTKKSQLTVTIVPLALIGTCSSPDYAVFASPRSLPGRLKTKRK
ncbi:MAG: hypothetical protein M3Y53_05600 [Thermoproteota archaeon]|nr:hypothetical protein [Thermoproteota archaeon]MDQ6865102.1 hypothetical protein [Thermoproteota archaeon]